MTDRALIDGAHTCGLDRSHDPNSEFERVSELPFEPARGYHAVHGRIRGTDEREYLCIKGAPERVIPLCSQHGREFSAIDEVRRTNLIRMSEQLAGRGLRVLAVAERRLSARERIADRHVVDLCFRGFVAFADPVRGSASQAVDAIRKAGVRIVMITGDHPRTAAAVATELGIDEWRAQVLPDDKLAVVRSLQDEGYTVAMVGDGTNDAPALAAADIGIAMGLAGTDVAVETADVALSGDELGRLLELRDLGGHALDVIRQNYAMSIAVNAIGLVIGAGGALSPVLAAVLHNASSVAVVGNSSRLIRYQLA